MKHMFRGAPMERCPIAKEYMIMELYYDCRNGKTARMKNYASLPINSGNARGK